MAEIKWVEVDGELKPQWDFPAPPLNNEFYENLREARADFRRVEDFVIPVEETGRGFVVKKGQTVRIVCVEGPQMADVCFWNANNYKERFWNDGTLAREGYRLTTFTRLWSNNPKYRPMMTVIEDTVEASPESAQHSMLTACCDPHYWYWALKDRTHPYVTTFNCYLNLLRAMAPFSLGAEDLHDNVNLFIKMYFTESGGHVFDVSDVKKGDYIEFYAEMDVLLALSICPGGSGSLHYSVGEQDVKPLGVEIYKTGIEPLAFDDGIDNAFGD